MMWYGPNDFSITPGRAYEMVAVTDDTLVIVGSNDPDGLIPLNYNTDRASRNWVSIPYNAVYSIVSDITHEYSSTGDPLESITNLRDDQVYETWLWDPVFMMWYGPADFAITSGRGYEMVATADSTWDPTEWSNEALVQMVMRSGVERSDVEVYGGHVLEPDRAPVWVVQKPAKRIDYLNAKVYRLVAERFDGGVDYREPGVSHIVRVHVDVQGFDGLVFTAYRPEQPYDVLTEDMVGSCVAWKGDRAAVWFNVGNFKEPWQDGEEVILIIEAVKQGSGYFTVLNCKLDEHVDVQDVVDGVALIPIPEPEIHKGSIRWDRVNNDNIVGYSIYQNDIRVNDKVITAKEYPAVSEVILKPVIKGGYETVYSSREGSQGTPDAQVPLSYAFAIFPNPFTRTTGINYALPHQTQIDIKIYDVSGRLVKTVVSDNLEPGYYKDTWAGDDDMGRKLAAGVYFIHMTTDDYKSHNKVIFVR